MKQKKLHPAIESAMLKARQRYIIFGVGVFVCAVIFAIGFIFKPHSKVVEAQPFSEDAPIDAYVSTELVLTSAMFEQDQTDEDGNVIGTVYYALAVDSDGKKFIISAPKEYYEENLRKLEDNTTVNIEDNSLEVLDENNKVQCNGYVREMSRNLEDALSSTDNEYNMSILSVVYKKVFDIATEPMEVTTFNPFYIAAGFAAVITLIILMTAVSASANLSRMKEKYEEKTVKVKKKKK